MRGRPVKEDKRSQQLRIRLNAEEAETLNKLSECLGVSKSEAIRLAFYKYLTVLDFIEF